MEIEELLEELDRLDARAFEMALAVSRKPAERDRLEQEAGALTDRLVVLADDLELRAPREYQERSDQISETLLDLSYVELGDSTTSLRLHRALNKD